MTVNIARAICVRMIKTCTQCGVAFDARGRAKTCSTDCSVARRRAAQAEGGRKRRQDPEYKEAEYVRNAEYNRKRRQDNPEYRAAEAERRRKRRKRMIKTCMHCGTEFAPGKRGKAKTCSTDCSVAAKNAYVAEYNRKRYQDQEFRAAQAERKRGHEYRAAQAEYNRKRLQDPEYKEARKAADRRRYHDRRAETVSRMLAMLNSGELAAYGTEPYFLYRFYDEDDTLLYIGITNDPERRLYQHTIRKPWADDIARTEYDVYANKTEAAAAEAALIKELGPLHNIVHNSVIKIPLTANETRC